MRGEGITIRESLVLEQEYKHSEPCYIIQDKLEVNKYDNRYYIKSPRGVAILTPLQYEILKHFSSSCTVDEVINRNEHIDSSKLKTLIRKFVFEKLIIEPGSSPLKRKTLGYYFRVATKFKIPTKPFVFLVNRVLCRINIWVITLLSVILIIASIFTNMSLITYTEFSWNDVPRLLSFFLIGIFIALYHELWMARFISVYGGKDNLRFKLRFLLGVFVSVVVNWEYLLSLERKKAVKTILHVDLITAGLCGSFSLIGYCFMLLGMKNIAFAFCCFSIIGFSYMVLNFYPFLFKSDGYNILCLVTNASRLRHYFFKIIISVLQREKIDYIEKGKLWVYLFWGAMFIATLFFLQYAVTHGIRIRI